MYQSFPERWILVETTTLFYFWIHPEIASEMRTLLVLYGMSTQFLKNFHPVFNPTGNPAMYNTCLIKAIKCVYILIIVVIKSFIQATYIA